MRAPASVCASALPLIVAILIAGPAFAQPASRPLHASAPLAYAISAGATVGTVGLGYALYRVLPPGDPYSDAPSPRAVAFAVVAIGALAGPSVGNLTLGAVEDANRAIILKATGIGAGAAIALASVIPLAGCMGGSSCPLVVPLVYAGAAVAVSGVVVGTLYDLATIPGNATEAERRTVAVGLGGAGLALTLRL